MVHEIRPEFASIRSRQGRFGGVEIGALNGGLTV